jgi:hypothetical protein
MIDKRKPSKYEDEAKKIETGETGRKNILEKII